jgi:WD40 repeat protein
VRGDVRSRRVAGALAVGGAVLLVAVALAWTRWGRAPTEPKEPADLPAPPLSLRPVELSQEVKALLETPPERRDDRWRERARTMLMLPIPTRVPCPWLARPLKVLLVGDHAIALDPHGRVTSCAISTGTADTIADGVTCLQEVDDTMFGVAFRDLRIAVYRHRASGWSPVPLEGPTMAPGIVGPGDCTFQVTAQGHASPRISLQAPRAWSNHDVDVFAGGGRTIRVKGDYSLWVQAGDAPPALLVPSPVGWFKFDEALHYAVAQTSEHVRIYDVVSGTLVAEAPLPEAAYGVFRGFSRDGSAAVVLGSDGRLLWWRRGQRQWRSQPIAMTAPGGMQLSRRGERVVMWDPLNGGLDVRDLTSGRRYSLTDARIRKAEFLDDDQVVAIVEPGGVWRWSLAHQRSWVLADHGGPAKQGMWGFTTCDRGSSVVTGTNREDQEILMSSPSGGPQVVLPKPPGARIYGLACRGDRILAGTRDGHVLEWQWPTGRALAVHDLGVRAWIWTVAMAQPADGPGVVLLGTGQIRDPEPRNRVGGRVIALRNGDLTTLASTGLGGNTGIDDLAVSSDGRRAVAVSSSSQLVLIDVAGVAASPPQNGHTGEVGHVRFLEGDRSVVTAGDDGYLRIWDIVDGALALRSEVPLGHGRILTLDIRGTVAMVGTSDGHLGAWDLTTGSLVRAYRGHSSWVVDGVFDASGQWIASGDYEGRVCLHRIDLDDCYAALVGHQRTPVSHVRFLDDGQIITVSEDGTIRQWKPPYEASSAELACELEGYLFERGVSGAAMHGCAEDEPRLGHAVRRDDPIGAQRRPSGGGL